jgi:TonB-linked SusC/RagA family outer membrane protein
MMKRALTVLMGIALFPALALAQQKTVTGKVTSEAGAPLSGVAVVIKGTTTGTSTSGEGNYTIRASVGQVLQYRLIGTSPEERTVGSENVINVSLKRVASNLDAVVVTALGQTTAQRALGTAQQTVSGSAVAETQRENFINALQGRVAGVEVTSSSGVPGASSMITIRGVSSISSNNQPLMIIDGLPVDNKTLNTGVLASDAPGSATAFSNRGVDFTNRASDFNPEDIESITVLKGPEAAALYGIDAANGAIVITTKRGKAGVGGLDYSNSFRLESTRARPEIQHTYGPSAVGSTTFLYFGSKYPAGTQFYDNIDGFFQTALTQKHNLSFSGAGPDGRVTYRVSGGSTKQEGVIRNSTYNRINLTGASTAQVTNWLGADLSMQYAYVTNRQPWKGDGGPLLGLLVWPDTNNAKDYLTPAGQRRRLTALSAASEVDNPYFSVNANQNDSKDNRINANLGLTLTPVKWATLRTNLGTDAYTTQYQLKRDPQSALANTVNGILDVADDIARNLNAQTVLNFTPYAITKDISITGLVGNQIQDSKVTTDALKGQDFLDPNFTSVNNTNLRFNRTTTSQRRLVGAFAQATFDYKKYLFVTATGRNDWTSTIPQERNSFFYPGVSTSFIFSDAFPSIGKYVTGKLRAGYAEVGKDARPYAYRPSLEFKTTSNGGYGYGFTGPNLGLKPEFARSYEFGGDFNFLDGRMGIEATVFHKQTKDQIVNDIRGSYATGFILFNLNGAETKNDGLELTFHATPIESSRLSWDFQANFTKAKGKVLALPNALPESYVSDTWLYGNVRNGTGPGLSTMSLTGLFYLRNNAGDILIDPTSGLPIRSTSFIDGGYDRQPDFTIGISNTLRRGKFALDFLVDLRKGGDVFNATQHFLTIRGLATSTLDRDTPRIVKGVLRDGKENSANPTQNTIAVVPSVSTNYYTGMCEELFIEKNINWLRLRDVQLSYQLPERFLNARNARVFVKATDLFLLTNYTGMDPIVNGNSAAVGGSSGAGIDYGNFPMPRGLNFGLSFGY